jgi:hypothetical protein
MKYSVIRLIVTIYIDGVETRITNCYGIVNSDKFFLTNDGQWEEESNSVEKVLKMKYNSVRNAIRTFRKYEGKKPIEVYA